jgi:hypothetical protein
MPSLNEIIANEEIVLVDSNIVEGTCEHSFCEYMYDSKDFSEINNGMIDDVLATFKCSLGLLNRDNVWTIEEVANEIKTFSEILGNKLSYISDAGTNKPTWMKSKGKFEPRKKIDVRNNVRSNLTDLQDTAYEASRMLKLRNLYDNNRLGIDLRGRDILLTMAKEISSSIGLKPLKYRKLNKNKQIDRSNMSDTDERLVTALYCLSLYSGKRASLVSADTDFVRLLGVLPRIMGADEFLPYNSDFKEALNYNPFKFYLQNQDTKLYELSIDSSKVQYNIEFEIHNLPNRKVKEIKMHILDLWNEFSQIGQMDATG